MYLLYASALLFFGLSYLSFRAGKKAIGNLLAAIGMFLNPLGYDVIVYWITGLTHNYWMTMSFMYVGAGVFFGLFIYLYNINLISAFKYHAKGTHNRVKTTIKKMDKSFNELFDEFFKRNNIKPNDKLSDVAKDNAKQMIDMLTNSKDVENIDETTEKEIDATLGKPDKIEFYNEGPVFFERRIWHTPNGDLVKLIVTDEPTLNASPVPEKDLKEQLAEAVATEQFEKAAAIRDEIKKRKKEQKNKK
jgi:hypothetical protein